jgi:hypothetical protein
MPDAWRCGVPNQNGTYPQKNIFIISKVKGTNITWHHLLSRSKFEKRNL